MKSSNIFVLSLLAASGLCTAEQANMPEPTAVTVQVENNRAVQCSALAHIPANVEAWAAVNFGNSINAISKLYPTNDFIPYLAMMGIDSAAIAITDETPEVINQAGDLMAAIMQYTLGSLVKEWSYAANETAAPALSNFASQLSSPEAEKATERSLYKALINTPLPGAYAAISFMHGNEQTMAMMQQQLLILLDKELAGNYEAYNNNGWTGARLFVSQPENFYTNPAPTAEELEQLSKRSYYIVSRIEGNTLLIATADSEDKLKAVSTGAPSVLNTDKAAGLDSAAQGKMLTSFYLGKDTLNAYYGIYTKFIQCAANTFNGAFAAAAAAMPDKQDSLQQAIGGMNNLATEISKLYAEQNHPLTITAWYDSNLHLELACDAGGMEFTKAQVDTTCQQGTLVQAYGSTLRFNNLPDLCNIVNSAGLAVDGVAETLPLHHSMTVKGWSRLIKMAPPIAAIVAEPVLKMYNGLGNGWTLNVALTNSKFGGISPIITGSITLNDRKMFEEGWNDIRNIAVALTAMDSSFKAQKLANILNFEASTLGDATVYTNKHLTTFDFSFAYALSDSKLGITTQADHINFAMSAPTEEVAGITVNVDLQPILPVMHRNHEAMKAMYGENATYPRAILSSMEDNIKSAENFINIISGGKLNVTTEGGKLRTVVDIYTPALK